MQLSLQLFARSVAVVTMLKKCNLKTQWVTFDPYLKLEIKGIKFEIKIVLVFIEPVATI